MSPILTTNYSPAPGVLETVVNDEDLPKDGVPTHASHDKDAVAMSKQAMKAYRRAKKAGKVQDARARMICAEMRAKREGTPTTFNDVAPVAPKKAAQTSFNDF